ncbi:39K protein [Apocheima cinerarium nucleopolyhedrovirus]|uniref:39K protein n=1 Tax=Apocheima cinerarium nucleopolyhedrovirus TaxID=307461 RepID=UPI0001D920C4|nr:39K protein [Apocheima cinerarium nucleopolyhedrovirus]ADB84457.1 39K protein [Apocheima cinerarium nucleopolyhedrovirus]
MVGQTQTMIDILSKYENSTLNKTDNEINLAKIKLFEKKKMAYRFVLNEVHSLDKKVIKKGKKIITNNKYILFNSWYTKIRKSYWPSSHDMWNNMKDHVQCKSFIDIFDYMEKLGKSIKVQRRDSQSNLEISEDEKTELRKKKHDMDLEEIKESNNQRIKMYNEFYRVLSIAFETDNSPTSSIIYDNVFTKAFIENGMRAFKSVVLKIKNDTNSVTITVPAAAAAAVPVEEKPATRKRKQSVPSKKASKQKRVEEYTMVNDHVEDSQLSD